MKTPREILLERHRPVVPSLDAIRREVIAQECGEPGSASRGWRAWPVLAWHELFWPCRYAWACLATLWLVLFALNASFRGDASGVAGSAPVPSPDAFVAFWRQERALVELIEPGQPRAAVPRKTSAAQPRSQGCGNFQPV
jgi:hypothetical protein